VFTVPLSGDEAEAPDEDAIQLGGYERVGDRLVAPDAHVMTIDAPLGQNQAAAIGTIGPVQSSLPQGMMVDRRVHGPRRTP